jgi:serine/threonine-protein kinase
MAGFEETYRIVADLPAGDALKAQRALTIDGREVVLKTVKPVAPDLFVLGLARLSEVRGPHNEHVLDWEAQDRYVALAAEPVRGVDLGHVLAQAGSLSPQAAAALAAQAAGGLAALHGRGVVHGAVRPAALIRDEAGTVVLVDAGLAQAQGGADLSEQAPPRNAAYVSPEEVLGRPLVPASDVYSLGVVLYQLVTGRLPFDGQNAFTVAEDHVGAPVIAPRRLNPAVPAPLEAVILRALAKPPEDRYASGRELAAALEDESQATLVAAPAAAPVAAPRRKLWPWIVAAVVAAAVVLAVLWAAGVFAQKATVPNVVGVNLTSAQATVAGAGFKLGTIAYQQAVGKPQGTILSQTPAAGTQASKGATIDVVAVGSTVQTVPDVIGMTQSAAAGAITAAGLSLGHVAQVYNGTAPAGTVTDQAPNAGLTAPAGSQVAITVSRGPTPSASPAAAAVPDVVGQSEAQVTGALQAAGFAVVIERFPSATAPVGTVIDQTPAAGVVAQRGTTVTVVVSSGPSTSSPAP